MLARFVSNPVVAYYVTSMKLYRQYERVEEGYDSVLFGAKYLCYSIHAQ